MDLLKVFIPNASLDFGGFIFGWKAGKAGKLGFGYVVKDGTQTTQILCLL